MTIRLFLLLVAGACMLAFAMWAMWPRKKVRAGPENNWQQRDGTEVFSAETDANGGTTDPVTVAIGTGGTGVF
jgi:hypothetical protein